MTHLPGYLAGINATNLKGGFLDLTLLLRFFLSTCVLHPQRALTPTRPAFELTQTQRRKSKHLGWLRAGCTFAVEKQNKVR